MHLSLETLSRSVTAVVLAAGSLTLGGCLPKPPSADSQPAGSAADPESPAGVIYHYFHECLQDSPYLAADAHITQQGNLITDTPNRPHPMTLRFTYDGHHRPQPADEISADLLKSSNCIPLDA